jgi:hypothetical protein
MYDHGQKDLSPRKASAKAAATGEADRRSNDRHAFSASAEVVELSSGVRISTRTTDLGPGGCFIDTLIPFPVGAEVRLVIRKAKTQVEADGVVVYSQTGLGMGVEFNAMKPDQRQTLDVWLDELTRERQGHAHELARRAEKPTSTHGSDHETLVRLVHLMIAKGSLTEAEGTSILHDPSAKKDSDPF